MKISKDIIYQSFLALILVVPTTIQSPEVNLILTLCTFSLLAFGTSIKLTKTLLNTVIPLVLIIGIGITSSLFYKVEVYDLIKDIFLFLKPLLYILIGYLLAKRIRVKRKLITVFVNTAVILAVIHIFVVFSFLMDNPIDIAMIRYHGGKSNFVELFCLVIIFINQRYKVLDKTLKYLGWIKLILIISFIFYFSRTMLVGFVLLMIGINGYLKLSKKGLNYIFGASFAIIIIYGILYTMDLERGATGLEGFAYKIKIAPVEIFASEIDKENHAELWDNWRGYEVVMALEAIHDTPYYLGYLNGKGFGSLIDLGFVAPLNEEGIQFTPKIHNGFINVLFKTGLLGLLFYFCFLIVLYLQAYINSSSEYESLVNNTISAIGIYFVFTSFIISGIYNQADVLTLVLGSLIYIHHYYFRKNDEISYIRNSRHT